jgi:aspartate kinase
MRSHAGVAARIFSTLSNIGINIIMISTSEIRVSCIIDKQFTEKAVHALHDEFKLDEEPTPVSQSATGTSPTA